MTADELRGAQEKFDEAVWNVAKEQGLLEDGVEGPILDGVADEQEYLKAPLKILWLLLEPYDEGDNRGGGWSLAKHVFLHPKPADPDNLMLQTVAYATWCFRNNKLYKDIPSPEVAFAALRGVAWVNIAKMPACSKSNPQDVVKKYKNYWRELVHRQIKMLSPDVVIVAGSHYNHLQRDEILKGDGGCVRGWPSENQLTDLHYCDDYAVLYAYHPAYWKGPFHRPDLTQESYVNSVADALSYVSKHPRLTHR